MDFCYGEGGKFASAGRRSRAAVATERARRGRVRGASTPAPQQRCTRVVSGDARVAERDVEHGRDDRAVGRRVAAELLLDEVLGQAELREGGDALGPRPACSGARAKPPRCSRTSRKGDTASQRRRPCACPRRRRAYDGDRHAITLKHCRATGRPCITRGPTCCTPFLHRRMRTKFSLLCSPVASSCLLSCPFLCFTVLSMQCQCQTAMFLANGGGLNKQSGRLPRHQKWPRKGLR